MVRRRRRSFRLLHIHYHSSISDIAVLLFTRRGLFFPSGLTAKRAQSPPGDGGGERLELRLINE